MDYEKKYKEALEKARQFSEKPYLEDSKGIVEYIFPELKESEDEMVKKRILLSLEKDLMATKNSGCDTQDLEQCIAWLEKQGEQKPIDYTHTNVFTEKAAIWFNNNFIVHDEYGVISDSFDTKEEMFEDFKNYMKEE